MEKNILQYYTWVVYGTQSQGILCPRLNRTTISDSFFQNNCFKKHTSQKTKLNCTCLKCLFLWPHWLSFCRSLCLIMIEKKPRTVTINKKSEILCQNKTNLITLNVKKGIYFLPIAIKFYIS